MASLYSVEYLRKWWRSQVKKSLYLQVKYSAPIPDTMIIQRRAPRNKCQKIFWLLSLAKVFNTGWSWLKSLIFTVNLARWFQYGDLFFDADKKIILLICYRGFFNANYLQKYQFSQLNRKRWLCLYPAVIYSCKISVSGRILYRLYERNSK